MTEEKGLCMMWRYSPERIEKLLANLKNGEVYKIQNKELLDFTETSLLYLRAVYEMKFKDMVTTIKVGIEKRDENL